MLLLSCSLTAEAKGYHIGRIAVVYDSLRLVFDDMQHTLL